MSDNLDLENLELLANGSGGSTPAASVTPSAPPRASWDNLVTLKERALQGLPPEWRERAIRDAGECGVRHDNNVGWLLIGSTVQSLFCAFAAGDAAQEVQAGVNKIQGQIFQGAIRAGDEVKGALRVEIRDRAVEAGQALKMLIDSAAGKGAESLKNAASDLDIKLGKIPSEVQESLDAYKKNGVAEFAKCAQRAGLQAARSAMLAQLSRSAMVSVLAFLFACGVGAGGLWGYLLITHRVMPAGVVAMADPLRGGDLLIVPTGGKPLPASQCPGGLCLIYKKGSVPDLP